MMNNANLQMQEHCYTVLLVDDEKLELDLLLEKFPWHDYSFQVCGLAQNGKQAMELVHRLHPDVVVTDIRMPVMDGVELSRRLYESYPNTIIAFLSGYDQFEYLKNALYVHAADYLLKPIDLSEAAEFLRSLRQRCDEQHSETLYQVTRITISIRRYLKTEDPQDLNSIRKAYLSQMGYEPASLDNPHFFLTTAIIPEYQFLIECEQQGISCIQEATQAVQSICTCQCIHVELAPDQFLLMSPDPIHLQAPVSRWLTVCSVDQAIVLEQLAASHRKLEQLCKDSAYLVGSGMNLIYPDHLKITPTLPMEKARPEFNLLLDAAAKKHMEQANQWLRQYCGCMAYYRDQTLTDQYISELLDVIYASIDPQKNINSDKLERKSVALRRSIKIYSPVLLQNYLWDIISAWIQWGVPVSLPPSNSIIDRVCAYIDENYAENLSVDQLAAKFNFSSNYLCVLFKKHTDKTILEYITDARLKQSIYLLQETPLRISQIASMVGYSTSSYFCSIFAKKFGITPTQYRNGVGK